MTINELTTNVHLRHQENGSICVNVELNSVTDNKDDQFDIVENVKSLFKSRKELRGSREMIIVEYNM